LEFNTLPSATSKRFPTEIYELNNSLSYVKEISDPNNRAEYDQYLEQLEAKGELPDGREKEWNIGFRL